MKKIKYLFTVLPFVALSMGSCDKKEAMQEGRDYTEYVDVFIGTDSHGHTFPGATRPNAMVQFSPDTHILGWEASSGYHYQDSTLFAFSLTHLSGTGIGDMGDVALLPFSKEPAFSDEIGQPYAVIDKKQEKGSPGYYSVFLKDQGIKAELTSTDRVGFMKLKYSDGKEKGLMLNLAHILQPNWQHKVTGNDFRIVNDSIMVGTYRTSGWAHDHQMSYCIKVKPAITRFEKIRDGKNSYPETEILSSDTSDIKIKMYFPEESDSVMVKIAISPVSTENAIANMSKELSHWDFEAVRDESKKIWNDLLGTINIETKDRDVMTNFYTSLYHSNIAPYNYQDVNGEFRAMDKKIYKGNPDDGHYTVFSLWDTYRALHPLLTIISPDKALRYGRSLVEDYKEGGILPKWPLASNYTGCMIGYHSVSVLADLVNKGLTKDEDLKLWTEACINTAMYREDLEKKFAGTRELDLITKHIYYKDKYGFVPCDSIAESVSWAVEMAYDDWCISQIAKSAGMDSVQKVFEDKASYYKKYWDKETNLMRPLNGNGEFLKPFNPRYSAHQKSDYTEGNAYQWSFYAPHDMKGFIELMGGKNVLEANLDTLFSTSSQIDGAEQSGDITGLIGQYAHGNEPSHHIAYLYNYTDNPYKGQKILDSVMYNFYKPTPDGIIGNEDCGQMSAWYVMSTLGFYQICPGDPVYHIGRPIIDKATIRTKDGYFNIVVNGNSRENKKISKVVLNGKDITKDLCFNHSAIKNGGKLEIWMTK